MPGDQLQPLDVSINEPLDDDMHKEWKIWMMLQSEQTRTDRMKKPTIVRVYQSVRNVSGAVKGKTLAILSMAQKMVFYMINQTPLTQMTLN